MGHLSVSGAVVAIGLPFLAACSGAVVDLGPPADAGSTSDGGAAADAKASGCGTDADCDAGICGFLIADGCEAVGQCVAAPPRGTLTCELVEPGCGCDGATVNLACNGYPSGYAAAAIRSLGPCSTLGTSTCTSNRDCGVGGACAFPVVGGCGVQGTCFAVPPLGPSCGGTAPSPVCTCGGETVDTSCTGYPYGTAPAPVLHSGACESVTPATFGGPP